MSLELKRLIVKRADGRFSEVNWCCRFGINRSVNEASLTYMIVVSLLHPLNSTSNQLSRTVYRVQVGERSFDLYLQSSSLIEQPGLEVALPLAILPGMRRDEPIHVEGAISETFLQGVREVMEHYASSFEGFTVVPITADSVYKAEPSAAVRKASFFSGGVDSFFSLLKARDELTDIITIRGFDMSLKDEERWEKTRASAQAVADELKIQLHEVECNFGSIIKAYGKWLEHGHGIALVSVARSMAGLFGEVRIPGSDSLEGQVPWGSSIFTDPKYSDERLTIVHDACEANRVDKMVYLGNEPLALKYLRVCPGSKHDGYYNCCRCEKCLRTMVSLYAIGVLDSVEAFPLPLTPQLVAHALYINSWHRMFTDENIELMERCRPDDTVMIKALKVQRDRPLWRSKVLAKLRRKRRHLKRKIKKLIGRVGLSPH